MSMKRLPPVSLYVHLPWCLRKCPYCDFNSHAAGSEPPKDRYVAALLADLRLEHAASRLQGREICSVFLGGGTPSLFEARQIGIILGEVNRLFGIGEDTEVTMEVNPGALEHGDLPGYRGAGVNRLSIGAQSFDARQLQRLGRIHSPAEIAQSVAEARRAGFTRINLDLMFALPGQDLASAAADIDRAIALGPTHVSYYQLTLEPNTVFYSRPPGDLPDQDLAWAIQTQGHERLGAAGFEQYEVSAFALPGEQCRHNLNYWRFGDYLAVGAGAHAKYTRPDGSVWRHARPAHPLRYIEECELRRLRREPYRVPASDLAFEFMLNVLRLPGGFTDEQLRARTGLAAGDLAGPLERALRRGLIEAVPGPGWRPTPLGWRFLNELQAEFLPA